MKKILLAIFLTALTVRPVLGADLLSGIPIGSSPDKAYLAFDGNPLTRYYASDASYAWVGLDLGSAHVITNVAWNSKNAGLAVIQGANSADFSDAVPIWVVGDSNEVSADINCSRGFRYVRYVGPANSYGAVYELQFYGLPGDGDDSRLWQITNLPTVSINTVDGEIPYDKEHDISSTVIIISDNGSKVLQQSGTNIRERGNASREFPKKPWRIKFDKKQKVLDAPAKAKKWTLINNYGDKTLMRNMLAFDIARAMGMKWVPFCTPVDVVLNGEYKGCYQLCDQVEVNDGRLEIDEMSADDNSGEALTGGYFVEVDAYAYSEPVWFQTSHYGLPVTVKSPDEDEITPEQLKYITDYFNMLEPKMKDTDLLTGYRSIFDNESFIQHMLVNEMAGNTDAYWSTYMYKQRSDPKIYTGPVWDFDLGFNNDNRTYPVYQKSGDGFLWNSGCASSAYGMLSFAQRILIKDPSTASEILDVWTKARKGGLSSDWLVAKVDEYSEMLDASQRLNFMRWPIMNTFVHQNPVIHGSYQMECKAVKDYMALQMAHLDKVIGYDEADSGVNPTCADNSAPAQYFTIYGTRIEQPQLPGVYIEQRGDTARKIIVK